MSKKDAQHRPTCVVIGSGIGGLGAAILLAQQGYEVTLLERHAQLGGRAGQLKVKGLTFDTGPSWYLMPELFEDFFKAVGEDIHQYLELERLTPSYRIYFEGEKAPVDIFSDLERDAATFERFEPGAGKVLQTYLNRSGEQYELVRRYFLNANLHRVRSYFNRGSLRAIRKIPLLGSMQSYVQRYFSDYRLQQLLQYTLVFLGSSPYNAPALYNIMSHLDFVQGVYYPKGGIYTLIEALEKLARDRGVHIKTGADVTRIFVEDGKATGVELADGTVLSADIVISNADMHHTETKMLPTPFQQYPEKYWQKRVMAPSALLIYLGVRGELPSLLHHTLYFSKDWRKNFSDIFDKNGWPEDPSIYVSNPSKTDPTITTPGVENVFVLVPIGAGAEDTEEIRAAYLQKVWGILETKLGIPDLQERITYQRVVGPSDFARDYFSYRGSALGMAHTLRQSAFGRPASQSKKVSNLFYVGSGVHPGIGMPVCLVSAQIAATMINDQFPCEA